MPKLKITCTHCGRVTAVDSEKVPDHPVAYRCASCKGKIVIDKLKILAGAGAPKPDAASGASSAAPGRPGAPNLPATAVRVEELMLPPGELLPPGYLIAENEALAAQLIKALKPYDCELERIATAEDAHRRAMTDIPPLIIYLAQSIGQPRFAPLGPLVNLHPRERRQTFITLLGDDAPTLDGNQAFLFQVDLLINHEHIDKAAGILHSALRYHQRLYRPYLAALDDNI
ncbi:MAG: zinc-ribbon domain-containing protein [Thermoanaerobaculia bacterium]|nr:zinc-ribbon domain-containing protein [Thermoanaerobaculia bacterium]